jgi:hypothetical protein
MPLCVGLVEKNIIIKQTVDNRNGRKTQNWCLWPKAPYHLSSQVIVRLHGVEW